MRADKQRLRPTSAVWNRACPPQHAHGYAHSWPQSITQPFSEVIVVGNIAVKYFSDGQDKLNLEMLNTSILFWQNSFIGKGY